MNDKVLSASSFPAGHGHKLIVVELLSCNKIVSIKGVTNNMPDYDKATELEGDEKAIALYNLIKDNHE